MKYADLHIHSSYSDGYFSPEQIVDLAIEQGIKYISITDHNTIKSQYIIEQNTSDIYIIPGIELSTEYKDMEIHILGYFIDINNRQLINVVNRLMESRLERTYEILKRLREINILIDMDDIAISKNQSIGRGNIANAIVEKGYAENFKEAFTNYLVQGKYAYVKGEKLGYKEALDIINGSGGLAVLAHPGKIYRDLELETIIRDLKCYGLKGLEVYHPSHTKKQLNTLYNLSRKYKLCITGGSDFHGSSVDSTLACQGINELLLEKIINFKQK